MSCSDKVTKVKHRLWDYQLIIYQKFWVSEPETGFWSKNRTAGTECLTLRSEGYLQLTSVRVYEFRGYLAGFFCRTAYLMLRLNPLSWDHRSHGSENTVLFLSRASPYILSYYKWKYSLFYTLLWPNIQQKAGWERKALFQLLYEGMMADAWELITSHILS